MEGQDMREETTAALFANNLPQLLEFYNYMNLYSKLFTSEVLKLFSFSLFLTKYKRENYLIS